MDGPAEGLFGTRCGRALDAFRRSLIGTGWPGFWLEAPLSGPACMDLHVTFGREQLRPGDRFGPGAGFGRQDLFDWYIEKEPGGNGLALSHDLGEAGSLVPGLAVNVNNASLSDPGGFFEAAGAPRMAEPVFSLMRRLPEGFSPWYLALMPNRPGTPGRVDCFLDRMWRERCAEDPGAFSGMLERLGFETMDADTLACLQKAARIPLEWEIQLNVLEDGSLRQELTLSLMIPARGRTSTYELFSESGPAAGAMSLVEGLGVADSRWRLIPEAALARMAPVMMTDGEPVPVITAVLPKFVKMKWDRGAIRTAKVYFSGVIKPLFPEGNAEGTGRDNR